MTASMTSPKVVYSKSRSRAAWAGAKTRYRAWPMQWPTGQAALGFRAGAAKSLTASNEKNSLTD